MGRFSIYRMLLIASRRAVARALDYADISFTPEVSRDLYLAAAFW